MKRKHTVIETSSEYINCVDCKNSFKFSTQDFKSWGKNGYDKPIRCKLCREAKKARNLTKSSERSKTQIEEFKKKTQSSLELNRQIVSINKEIAHHAKRKELKEAITKFESAIDQSIANSHTYAATLNAYIRCSEISAAKSLFDDMKLSKDVKLDVISCTTMMKGCGSCGDIIGCFNILEFMNTSKPKIQPNIRTINTFLRCCVSVGECQMAEDIMRKLVNYYIYIYIYI